MQAGVGAGDEPVAQDGRGQLLDVVRHNEVPPANGRVCLCRAVECETAARTDAQLQRAVRARRLHQVQQIVLKHGVDEDMAAGRDRALNLFGFDNRPDAGQRIVAAKAVQDLALLLALGIPHLHLNQKAVHLRLGQGECARQFDGILRRHQEEGIG